MEHRLHRLQSRGQDSDLEEYVKKVEERLEEADRQREKFSREVESSR